MGISTKKCMIVVRTSKVVCDVGLLAAIIEAETETGEKEGVNREH
jgi:hypothetical protein